MKGRLRTLVVSLFLVLFVLPSTAYQPGGLTPQLVPFAHDASSESIVGFLNSYFEDRVDFSDLTSLTDEFSSL